MHPNPDPPQTDAPAETYVGLGEAAEMLGLSRTSVQKLVDLGHVAAIRTAGGHRRLLRNSLLDYRRRMAQAGPRGDTLPAPPVSHPGRPDGFEVLLVDDDEVTISYLEGLLARHFPEFTRSVARDGLAAVLQIERRRPNLIITDLYMQPFDGFQLIRHIHGEPEYAGICVVALSGLSEKEIVQRGGLPPGVQLYRKPVQMERLLGYLEAHAQLLHKARLAAGAPA